MGDEQTYWNGRPCKARKVRVIVADAPEFPLYWAREFVGQERDAVEIWDADQIGKQPFYIDNENGGGWHKVTVGGGGPWVGHSDLAVERVLD